MPLTKKQELYLDIISAMTFERYNNNVETSEEADKTIQDFKDELLKNVTVKYFIYSERMLHIEIYIWDEYTYTVEVTCKDPVTEADTLDTIDIVSYWLYK